MNVIRQFLIGIIVSANSMLVAHCAQPESLTVMTWNLEWFYDEFQDDSFSKLAKEKAAPGRPAWAWHRDAIAASIAKAKPTILAMQEVENRRVLWYLSKSLDKHGLEYHELCNQSDDHFTEQDVGVLFREPANATAVTQFRQTSRQFKSREFYNVTKHSFVEFEFPVGDSSETVCILNIHLRSRAEGEPLRRKQAKLVHHWMANRIRPGDNVIILGDTNTEERGNETRADSDLGILCGKHTIGIDDDLYDLHFHLPTDQRQTHLLPGRQFDRILVSKSLLEDDPQRPDLVFESIAVLRELAVQGKQDVPEDHWGVVLEDAC